MNPHVPHPARVLLLDVGDAAARWLQWCLGGFAQTTVVSGTLPLDHGVLTETHAVISGRAADDPRLSELLESLGGRVPVLLLDENPSAPAVHDERVFYVLRPDLEPADVAALVRGAIHRPPFVTHTVESPEAAEALTRVLALASRFATRSDLKSAAATAEGAARELADADRAYCLFHDPDTGALWTEGEQEREAQANAGLVGFAACTGRGCAVARASFDPRYVAAIDDPGGCGEQRILVNPVAGPDGRVQAVLVVVRHPRRPLFTAEDQRQLATFAASTGPLMHHLALLVEARAILRAEAEHREVMFREEAVSAYAEAGHHGDVVRVMPAWIQPAYWLLLGLAMVSVAYLFVGRVSQYSSGPAIIRLHQRTEITAARRGALVSVDVEPGEHVEVGQVLARLDETEARETVGHLRREFSDRLRARMLDPSDASAIQTVSSLRRQLATALTELEQRELRATRTGVVSDIRVRPGQNIEVGETVLSILEEESDRHVVAFLPGGDRPQIHPDMELRLEVSGYPYTYQGLVVDWVSDEVIGPTEARRYLGPQVADALPIDGPLVMVRARLPEASFEALGTNYAYHDGMLATAEVAVRREPIIVTLFPFARGM